jgi:hypothetical protein
VSAHHVDVELCGGLDAMARIVARLHAVRADVSALRYDGTRVCLTLAGDDGARRVVSVLQRLADVRLVALSDRCTAAAAPVGTGSQVPPVRTSYAVARTPLAMSQ